MSLELDENIPRKIIPFPTMIDEMRAHDSSHTIKKVGPIEAQMRAVIAKLKGTKYPDSFDWSVYDRISRQFNEPPRGGVVFGTTFKLANWHPTCSKCHYAFELDTYGRGCFHDCKYCYAKANLTSYGYWNRPQPFPVDLAEIRKTFFKVFETDKPSKWRSILEQRIPLRLGSMSDSFMWLDTKYGVTKEVLRILNFYKYPHIIFTRSDLVAHDEYLEILDSKLASVQFSISGNNHALLRKIEPGAPSYKRRLRAIEKLVSHGFWTAVRINPLFPLFPDGYFTDPLHIHNTFGSRSACPSLKTFDREFVREIADSGASNLIVGFVRFPKYGLKMVAEALELDLYKFFKNDAQKDGDDWRYSDREISFYYRWFASECRANGLRFSTCYIGNGVKDYYQYQGDWTNKLDCCDVRGNVSSFKNSSQDIPWPTRKIHTSYLSLADRAEKQDIAAAPTVGVENFPSEDLFDNT